jgi:hypothetical protein
LPLPAIDARRVKFVIARQGSCISFTPRGYVVQTYGTLRHASMQGTVFFSLCLSSSASCSRPGQCTTLTHHELLTTKK